MALLRYKNFLVNDVVVLAIQDRNSEFLIQYLGLDGVVREKLFKKPDRFRVMINGNITNQICVKNCLVVYGDINKAKVGNSASVEGYVTNYNCPRNSITVDRTLKVAHGNDARINMGKQSKASILHIDGDIVTVSVDVYNVDLEVVVGGNIKSAVVDNCLSCRGTIGYLDAGNMIYCTMGKSKGKSPRQKRKEQKESEARFHKEMDVFKDLFRR